MNISYEGIGQWAATFACGEIGEGELVKISGSGEVSPCEAGDRFCGMTVSVGRTGACAVALGGMITAGYTGTAPTLGWCGLEADGDRGVRTAEGGGVYLVVDVDEASQTVTFAL